MLSMVLKRHLKPYKTSIHPPSMGTSNRAMPKRLEGFPIQRLQISPKLEEIIGRMKSGGACTVHWDEDVHTVARDVYAEVVSSNRIDTRKFPEGVLNGKLIY
jgi:hypothetical protein